MTIDENIRDVLARLSTLSEASASNLEPRTSHGKSDSKPPAGVRDRVTPTDPDRPPPKERSLYDWFRWQFEHVDFEDCGAVEKLVEFAEVEYKSRALHVPRRIALRSGKLDAPESVSTATATDAAWPAPTPIRRRDYHDDSERPNASKEIEDAASARVVEWYEGWSALEVALIENTTESWVLKARKAHARNLDDGRPRPPFLDWDDAERSRQIRLLLDQAKHRGENLGAKAIAKHFGVAKNTVRPYLEPQRVAA